MQTRDFAKLYFGLLILHLAVLYQPHSEALYYLSKPALIFSLLAFYLHCSASHPPTRWWIGLALLASLLGDILLMLPADNWRVWGILSFGAAHLCYTVFYLQKPWPGRPVRWWVAGAVPVVLAAGVYHYLELPPDQWTLPAYAVLLGLHFALSYRWGGWHHTAGAVLLFALSDILLLWQWYGAAPQHLELLVMACYAPAQYLIIIRLLRYEVEVARP